MNFIIKILYSIGLVSLIVGTGLAGYQMSLGEMVTYWWTFLLISFTFGGSGLVLYILRDIWVGE